MDAVQKTMTAPARARPLDRDEAREETREALLAAARQIFSQKGYHGTNVSDIVAAVGMAQGSFYNYFRNKKAIFRDILQAFVNRIAEAVENVDLESIQDDTSYYLVGMNLGSTLTGIFLEDHDLARIFFREAIAIDEDFDRIIDEAYGRVTDATQAYVEQGQKVGIVREDVAARVVATAMVGMCSHMFHRFLRNEFEGIAPGELLRTLVSIHLKGILETGH